MLHKPIGLNSEIFVGALFLGIKAIYEWFISTGIAPLSKQVRSTKSVDGIS